MALLIKIMSTTFVAICFATFFALAELVGYAIGCSCDHPDKVENFPGWDTQPLPSNWYSGYLHYELEGQQVHTHYVLVEAEGYGIEQKPLLYWSNGGPGGSSLFGLLTELGPLLLSENSLKTDEYRETGIPTPIYNPYSWTKLGSVLIIDQPAPVGFSYCNEDLDAHSCGGIKWTDELTSLNAKMAFDEFYKLHPCYQSKDLYLLGESYAGIYVPTLARRMSQDVQEKGDDSFYNILKGFAIGDGCLGTETGLCVNIGNPKAIDYWQLLFLAGHHQMSMSTYHDLIVACHPNMQDGSFDENEECRKQAHKAYQQVGAFYEYALYDDCTYQNGLILKGATNDYPCGCSDVMDEYLALQVVHSAFHVNSTFFEVDNAEGDFDYTPTEKNLMSFYQEVNGKLKVLVYNGDTDPAITSFATESWTSRLGFEKIQDWRPWTLDYCKRMGGYVTQYKGMFDFLTIRGSGHLVPAFKPAATFTFIQAWLSGGEYPTLDVNCTAPLATDFDEDDNYSAFAVTGAGIKQDVQPIRRLGGQ